MGPRKFRKTLLLLQKEDRKKETKKQTKKQRNKEKNKERKEIKGKKG